MRAFLFVALAASFVAAQGCAGNLPQSLNMSPPVRCCTAMFSSTPATGMDMMVSYEGIQTPYNVGPATGNIPE